MTKSTKARTYALLYGCYLIYSLCLVAAKFAAEFPLLSVTALSLYGLSLFLLGVFAFVWQQVLKRMTLTAAYANRAVTIIYSMTWGALLFAEKITWNMIAGGVIIMIGVVLVVMRRE